MNKDVRRLVGIAAGLILVTVVGATFYSRAQQEKRVEEAAKRPAPLTETFVRPHSHSKGPANAKVTIVEFLDPECESCRAMYPHVKAILEEFDKDVRVVLRYVPLHPNSTVAIGALEAAAEQGRYWDMMDILMLKQPEWGSHHAPRPELIPTYAQQIGLDMQAYERFQASGAHRAIVDTDFADARSLGVMATPTFFVNGKQLEQLGYEPLRALIVAELGN